MALSEDCPVYVSPGDSESLLSAVAAKVRDPNAGLFGPASLAWRIDGESALFLGSGRAALLQLAHPWVAAALAQHSTLLNQPIARFHNTFRIVFSMVFGSLGQALAASRHLYTLHTQIRGELPEDTAGGDAARWKRGSHYEANEIHALRWVFATLVESAVMAYECALGPMAEAEREQYYADSKTLAALFGLPAQALPSDWNGFTEYNRLMQASNELGVSSEARLYANRLLAGAGSWIRPPFWFRALTVSWLPARFRDEFSLRYGPEEQRAAESAVRWLPRVYRRLPASLRLIGPWRQAQARLAHRAPGLFTRMSNRFWIGEPLLPFAEESIAAVSAVRPQ